MNAAADVLIDNHLHLVTITARRFRPICGAAFDMEDLRGAGFIALCKAAEVFDPARGSQFQTLAITLIRGAILEFIRNQNWTPRSIRDRLKLIREADEHLSRTLPRAPLDEEIAEAAGISVRVLDETLKMALRCEVHSLQDPSLTGGEQIDLVAAPGPLPEDVVIDRELNDTLAAAISRLPERERQCLHHYYTEGMTYKAIGALYEISESRAYQLVGQAVKRLRSDGALRSVFNPEFDDVLCDRPGEV